jgi:hypothetical protein
MDQPVIHPVSVEEETVVAPDVSAPLRRDWLMIGALGFFVGLALVIVALILNASSNGTSF